ncbi:SCO family protein [Burkholderia ubonensis]|uniref:SCO family protein n=1 Tax=Burkholderia ubonensis TaxID=101571 RepID=UPI002ABD3250|nr:SCO family protein [Burkholderia ubonensis]
MPPAPPAPSAPFVRCAPRRRLSRVVRTVAALAAAVALAACTRGEPPWRLTDVTGHLPDLSFTLTGGDGRPVDASAFRGRISLVYFGYTHCPDVCPETMARLMEVLAQLGPQARNVRILFVSVDPARDTPQAMQSYVAAFDAEHARGLTGTDRQIESLAKRYRVAYQMEQRDPSGGYEVTHSSAVYIFDASGRARLLATDRDKPDAIAADVRRILDSASST